MKKESIISLLFGISIGALLICGFVLIILLSFTRQSYTIEMCKDLLTSDISFSNYTAEFVEISTCQNIKDAIVESYDRGKCINEEG